MFHAVTHFAHLTHGTVSSHVWSSLSVHIITKRHTLLPSQAAIKSGQVLSKLICNWPLASVLPTCLFWCLIAKCTVCKIGWIISFTISDWWCDDHWAGEWWVLRVFMWWKTLYFISPYHCYYVVCLESLHSISQQIVPGDHGRIVQYLKNSFCFLKPSKEIMNNIST